MQKADFIIQHTGLSGIAVENTLSLLDQDCSIPFIARYRKERTGGLDEVALSQIVKSSKSYEDLEKRRESILKTLTTDGFLTDELASKLKQAGTLGSLEDLYLPFKKKRKTKASQARELGLEPLARILMSGNFKDFDQTIHNITKGKISQKEALDGVQHIMAEWFSERINFRNQLRSQLSRGVFVSKVVKKKQEEEKARVFKDYFDYEEPISRMPSHRVLATFRGASEGFLKIGIQIDVDRYVDYMCDRLIRSNGPEAELIEKAATDAYKRLMFPSLEKEVLQQVKEKADEVAIKVFGTNLEQLLLAAPLGQKRILAIDPGFRTGCKVVCLDAQGNLLNNETVFPHAPQRQGTQASAKLKNLVESYKIEAIAIGNGTAARETENWVKQSYLPSSVEVFMVNEAGASIYSASKIAREEFPNYDITVRGAVSIGRRLADPLAELVKIDAKSIGVGQYQHDVDQNLLQDELTAVVSHCVNKVGVNLNTASKSLLEQVSGIGPKLAENIVNFRKENGAFASRAALKRVPRLGAKAFEQAAAFLRVPNSKNSLDNSAVHPESYGIVKKMAESLGISQGDLIGNSAAIAQLKALDFIDDSVGLPTINDILKELKKPGVDPREKAVAFSFDASISKIEDLKIGMELPGIINNITNFGCFVDIGIKQSGLVHISRISKAFIRDINEHVKLGDHVKVMVDSVDIQRKRIQLVMDF
ncbi:MAG: Tex family protein [Flavobacteriaceae bacterium]